MSQKQEEEELSGDPGPSEKKVEINHEYLGRRVVVRLKRLSHNEIEKHVAKPLPPEAPAEVPGSEQKFSGDTGSSLHPVVVKQKNSGKRRRSISLLRSFGDEDYKMEPSDTNVTKQMAMNDEIYSPRISLEGNGTDSKMVVEQTTIVQKPNIEAGEKMETIQIDEEREVLYGNNVHLRKLNSDGKCYKTDECQGKSLSLVQKKSWPKAHVHKHKTACFVKHGNPKCKDGKIKAHKKHKPEVKRKRMKKAEMSKTCQSLTMSSETKTTGKNFIPKLREKSPHSGSEVSNTNEQKRTDDSLPPKKIKLDLFSHYSKLESDGPFKVKFKRSSTGDGKVSSTGTKKQAKKRKKTVSSEKLCATKNTAAELNPVADILINPCEGSIDGNTSQNVGQGVDIITNSKSTHKIEDFSATDTDEESQKGSVRKTMIAIPLAKLQSKCKKRKHKPFGDSKEKSTRFMWKPMSDTSGLMTQHSEDTKEQAQDSETIHFASKDVPCTPVTRHSASDTFGDLNSVPQMDLIHQPQSNFDVENFLNFAVSKDNVKNIQYLNKKELKGKNTNIPKKNDSRLAGNCPNLNPRVEEIEYKVEESKGNKDEPNNPKVIDNATGLVNSEKIKSSKRTCSTLSANSYVTWVEDQLNTESHDVNHQNRNSTVMFERQLKSVEAKNSRKTLKISLDKEFYRIKRDLPRFNWLEEKIENKPEDQSKHSHHEMSNVQEEKADEKMEMAIDGRKRTRVCDSKDRKLDKDIVEFSEPGTSDKTSSLDERPLDLLNVENAWVCNKEKVSEADVQESNCVAFEEVGELETKDSQTEQTDAVSLKQESSASNDTSQNETDKKCSSPELEIVYEHVDLTRTQFRIRESKFTSEKHIKSYGRLSANTTMKLPLESVAVQTDGTRDESVDNGNQSINRIETEEVEHHIKSSSPDPLQRESPQDTPDAAATSERTREVSTDSSDVCSRNDIQSSLRTSRHSQRVKSTIQTMFRLLRYKEAREILKMCVTAITAASDKNESNEGARHEYDVERDTETKISLNTGQTIKQALAVSLTNNCGECTSEIKTTELKDNVVLTADKDNTESIFSTDLVSKNDHTVCHKIMEKTEEDYHVMIDVKESTSDVTVSDGEFVRDVKSVIPLPYDTLERVAKQEELNCADVFLSGLEATESISPALVKKEDPDDEKCRNYFINSCPKNFSAESSSANTKTEDDNMHEMKMETEGEGNDDSEMKEKQPWASDLKRELDSFDFNCFLEAYSSSTEAYDSEAEYEKMNFDHIHNTPTDVLLSEIEPVEHEKKDYINDVCGNIVLPFVSSENNKVGPEKESKLKKHDLSLNFVGTLIEVSNHQNEVSEVPLLLNRTPHCLGSSFESQVDETARNTEIDLSGESLEGGHHHRLNMKKDVPIATFPSVREVIERDIKTDGLKSTEAKIIGQKLICDGSGNIPGNSNELPLHRTETSSQDHQQQNTEYVNRSDCISRDGSDKENKDLFESTKKANTTTEPSRMAKRTGPRLICKIDRKAIGEEKFKHLLARQEAKILKDNVMSQEKKKEASITLSGHFPRPSYMQQSHDAPVEISLTSTASQFLETSNNAQSYLENSGEVDESSSHLPPEQSSNSSKPRTDSDLLNTLDDETPFKGHHTLPEWRRNDVVEEGHFIHQENVFGQKLPLTQENAFDNVPFQGSLDDTSSVIGETITNRINRRNFTTVSRNEKQTVNQVETTNASENDQEFRQENNNKTGEEIKNTIENKSHDELTNIHELEKSADIPHEQRDDLRTQAQQPADTDQSSWETEELQEEGGESPRETGCLKIALKKRCGVWGVDAASASSTKSNTPETDYKTLDIDEILPFVEELQTPKETIHAKNDLLLKHIFCIQKQISELSSAEVETAANALWFRKNIAAKTIQLEELFNEAANLEINAASDNEQKDVSDIQTITCTPWVSQSKPKERTSEDADNSEMVREAFSERGRCSTLSLVKTHPMVTNFRLRQEPPIFRRERRGYVEAQPYSTYFSNNEQRMIASENDFRVRRRDYAAPPPAHTRNSGRNFNENLRMEHAFHSTELRITGNNNNTSVYNDDVLDIVPLNLSIRNKPVTNSNETSVEMLYNPTKEAAVTSDARCVRGNPQSVRSTSSTSSTVETHNFNREQMQHSLQPHLVEATSYLHGNKAKESQKPTKITEPQKHFFSVMETPSQLGQLHEKQVHKTSHTAENVLPKSIEESSSSTKVPSKQPFQSNSTSQPTHIVSATVQARIDLDGITQNEVPPRINLTTCTSETANLAHRIIQTRPQHTEKCKKSSHLLIDSFDLHQAQLSNCRRAKPRREACKDIGANSQHPNVYDKPSAISKEQYSLDGKGKVSQTSSLLLAEANTNKIGSEKDKETAPTANEVQVVPGMNGREITGGIKSLNVEVRISSTGNQANEQSPTKNPEHPKLLEATVLSRPPALIPVLRQFHPPVQSPIPNSRHMSTNVVNASETAQRGSHVQETSNLARNSRNKGIMNNAGIKVQLQAFLQNCHEPQQNQNHVVPRTNLPSQQIFCPGTNAPLTAPNNLTTFQGLNTNLHQMAQFQPLSFTNPRHAAAARANEINIPANFQAFVPQRAQTPRRTNTNHNYYPPNVTIQPSVCTGATRYQHTIPFQHASALGRGDFSSCQQCAHYQGVQCPVLPPTFSTGSQEVFHGSSFPTGSNDLLDNNALRFRRT